jgi:hypothetical protein
LAVEKLKGKRMNAQGKAQDIGVILTGGRALRRQ